MTDLDWNSVRAVIPVALAQGRTIYAADEQGALWCNIYPPVGHLLLTPSALFSIPSHVILAGQLLCMAYLLIPLALVPLSGNNDPAETKTPSFVIALGASAITLTATLLLRPLTDAAMMFHIDAPALGLAVLAAAAALRPTSRRLILSALLSAGALAAKQTLLGIPLAIMLYIAFGNGIASPPLSTSQKLKSLLIYFIILILSLGSLITLSIAYFGFHPLFHSIITIPSRHEFPGGFTDSLRFALIDSSKYILPLLAVCLVSVYLAPARQRFALFFLLAAALTFPPALLGAMKFGGGPNNYALPLTFILASLLSAFPALPKPATYSLLALAPIVGLYSLANTPTRSPVSPHDQAYRLIKASPGTYYFPWHPLSHLLAEKRETHQSWGVVDRVAAGEDPSDSYFHAYMPPDPQYICLPPTAPPDRLSFIYLRLRPQYSQTAQLDELPSWFVATKPVPSRNGQ